MRQSGFIRVLGNRSQGGRVFAQGQGSPSRKSLKLGTRPEGVGVQAKLGQMMKASRQSLRKDLITLPALLRYLTQ